MDALLGRMGGHPLPGIQRPDGEWEFTFPTQKEINELDTPFLRACLELNNRIALFGLPHSAGWLAERNTILQIREICQSEKNRYEAWHIKNSKNLEDRD